MTRHSCDVAIVGRGVVGLAIALALADRGLTVCSIGRDTDPSASSAAGAMLGAFGEVSAWSGGLEDELEGALRIAAARRYAGWLDEHLPALGGGAIRRGTFIVANGVGIDDIDSLAAILTRAHAAQEPCERVSPHDVPGVRPHKSNPLVEAIFLKEEGWIDSSLLLAALRHRLAVHSNVRVLPSNAVSTNWGASDKSIVLTSGERVSPHRMVIAAGALSSDFAPWHQASAPLKVIGGRGTSLVVQGGEIDLPHVVRTPNRDFACGLHMVPLAERRIYLGATNRTVVTPGSDGGSTLGELEALLHAAVNEMHVGLRTASIDHIRSGVRPLSTDGSLLLGESEVDGVFYATGTYRNGVLLAPAMADVIAADIIGTACDISNPFSVRNRRPVTTPVLDRDWVRRGVRDIVSFIQEPDGALPYNRAQELTDLLSGLLHHALGGEDPEALIPALRDTLNTYPIREAFPMMLYLASRPVQTRPAGRRA